MTAAYILAGGPSASCEMVAGLSPIAVINSAWKTAPHADLLFFGDERWFKEFGPKPNEFAGEIIAGQGAYRDKRVRVLNKVHPPAFPMDGRSVCYRRTSVTGAINIMAQRGFRRIGIFGLDGKTDEAAAGSFKVREKNGKVVTVNGARHHHGDVYPWVLRRGCFDEHDAEFRSILPAIVRHGVEVVNLNPDSAITAFPKMRLDEFQ